MKIELSEYFKLQGFRSAYLFINNKGRKCVELVHNERLENGRRRKRFISYAKFLWISHYNKEVEKGYEIDHINNKPQDDRIENLQVLSKSENIKKEYDSTNRMGKLVADLICPICGRTFTKRVAEASNAAKKQPNCCSQRCSAKLQVKGVLFDRNAYLKEIQEKAYKKIL